MTRERRPWGYDRQGKPLRDMWEWTFLHADLAYVHVAATAIDDEVYVSTVWIGVDHGPDEHGRPIIFETMAFGGPVDEWQWRYATEEDALAGHEEVVEMIRAKLHRPIS